MGKLKLVLEDDFKEDFQIVAIHCGAAPFKLAYYLNKYVNLRLKRRRTDLAFSKDGLEVQFPLFEFKDTVNYTVYDLVSNTCKTAKAHTTASGGLFGTQATEENITTYLVPEYKNVDYFLKITSEYDQAPINKLLSEVNKIKPVISSYHIENEQIKSKNNLIFS
ncbi:IPExxxVDY family protein [Marixanthomonas spongiae]|uniref:IPExxxVDY family protein n=1 Tax=Marixanthomonas spongiae TaxID=2174845 RepID=A0A2U0I2B8_9FLAO|nr:IPExxxVDY family protein [Marixanthomonas spongiae]PVW15245.1 IPExxxVDY family protein [Marixanthomonas spongiae]